MNANEYMSSLAEELDADNVLQPIGIMPAIKKGLSRQEAEAKAQELGYNLKDVKMPYEDCQYMMLMNDIKVVEENKVYRIVALIDSEDGTINAGDKLGWTSRLNYIQIADLGGVYNNAVIIGNVSVFGKIRDNAIVRAIDGKSVEVHGEVEQDAKIVGGGFIGGTATISGKSEIKCDDFEISEHSHLVDCGIMSDNIELNDMFLTDCIVTGQGEIKGIDREQVNKKITVGPIGTEVEDI